MAGRKCIICFHENREAIESELRQGDSFRAIARHFALAKDCVRRHTQNCLKLDISALIQQKNQDVSLDWFAELSDALAVLKTKRDELDSLLKHAESVKEKVIVIKAYAELVGRIESIIDKGFKLMGAYSKDPEDQFAIKRKALAVLGAVKELQGTNPNADPDELMLMTVNVAAAEERVFAHK